LIGERIGHFEIVARAGRGGMGEVFVAEHATIKTKVAIKVLHADVSANTDHVQRFFNEARAVARIEHAGIVKMFDVGFHSSGRAYLIMEFLSGETLAARLRRAHRLSPRDTAEIARQITSVLDATHHAGVVHRDLKPDNVFLVKDRELASGERVKILDFGIAKLSGTLTGPTTIGTIGTPAYMAPEQWSDSSTVDWRADVYSLGCILYEMASGRTPFAASSIAEACARHLNDVPGSLRGHAPDVPGELDALALRLLAKDPAARTGSLEALEDQLAGLAATLPATAPPRDASQIETGPPPVTTLSGATGATTSSGGRRRLAASLAAVIVLAIGGLALWRVRRAPALPPAVSPAALRVAPDAAPPAPPARGLIEWLEAANPFVAWHGAQWLAHQVTRREYRQFLESLPVGEALRLQPVTGWDDREPARPVAWVTYERAATFCAAIHARLPTSDEWLAASEGGWGLDPDGIGRPGPLQEWTSTVHDGLVVVRGGHERMSPAARETAAREPLMKSTEAAAGEGPAPNVVASDSLGFRCVR